LPPSGPRPPIAPVRKTETNPKAHPAFQGQPSDLANEIRRQELALANKKADAELQRESREVERERRRGALQEAREKIEREAVEMQSLSKDEHDREVRLEMRTTKWLETFETFVRVGMSVTEARKAAGPRPVLEDI